MGRKARKKKQTASRALEPQPVRDEPSARELSRAPIISVDRWLVLAVAAYLGLAIFWAAPASLSPSESVPNHGDPLHLAWVMAWDAHQIVRDPARLFDSNAFYPYPRSLAFGDHLLPEALLGAPVFWASGNAVLASNVVVVAALTLSAAALFLLVRGITGSAPAAFVAGIAYAFNAVTLHELPRVHVLNLQWWPLALLFLDRFVRQGARPLDAALFAAALLLQCLSGTYYLAYSALFAPLWIAGAYVLAGRRPAAREVRALGAAAALAALPLAVIVTPYARQFRELALEKRQAETLLALPPEVQQRLRTVGFEGGFAPGADLLAFVDPPAGSVLWGGFSGNVTSELPHFVGFFSGALAAFGAASLSRKRPGRDVGALALGTAVLAAAICLGSRMRVAGADWGPGLYDLLHRFVPFARGMASPERFGVLVLLGGAILCGLGAARLLAGWRRTRIAGSVLLGALLVLEQWQPSTAPAFVPKGAEVPSVYRWLRDDGPGPVIELPLHPWRERRLWASYLYFSTFHWRPVPLGRSSFYPPAHDRLAWELRGFPDDRSLTLLGRLGIRTLVVHPLIWPEQERAARLASLDAQPRLRLVRRFDDRPRARFAALRLGEERVYRLETAAEAPRAPCRPEDELPRGEWRLWGSGLTGPDLVRDGDRSTVWFTLDPQRQGDALAVALPSPERLAAIVLEMAYPYEDFPRGLEVLVPDDAGGWRAVAYSDGPEDAWERVHDLVERPREASIVLRLQPETTNRFVLALGSGERDWAQPRWSVAELRAYRQCR